MNHRSITSQTKISKASKTEIVQNEIRVRQFNIEDVSPSKTSMDENEPKERLLVRRAKGKIEKLSRRVTEKFKSRHEPMLKQIDDLKSKRQKKEEIKAKK